MQATPSINRGTARSVHVGRQPIYDDQGRVVAFELLFRDESTALGARMSGSSATAQVIINTFSEFGLADIAGPHTCYVNLTRDFIVGRLPLPFGPQQVVLEVLETVEIDDEVAAGVATLVTQGYRIALDDYVSSSTHERLLRLASVVKLDFLGTAEEDLAAIARMCRRYPGITLLGEKLENEEHIKLARALGCRLFQGYLLSRPAVVSTVTLSPARVRQIELLTMLSRQDADITEITEMVTCDPALSLRLLRVSNSASSGLWRRVSSVHEAVMLLGLRRLREWVALMLVSDVAGHADETQLAAALGRARMCQEVAEHAGLVGESAFTAGLLVGIADLLGSPVEDLLGNLPVAPELSEALVNGGGRLGRILRAVDAYERADLAGVDGEGMDPAVFAQAYLSAAGWSMHTVSTVLRPGRA